VITNTVPVPLSIFVAVLRVIDAPVVVQRASASLTFHPLVFSILAEIMNPVPPEVHPYP
jgi:hypothetical protein